MEKDDIGPRAEQSNGSELEKTGETYDAYTNENIGSEYSVEPSQPAVVKTPLGELVAVEIDEAQMGNRGSCSAGPRDPGGEDWGIQDGVQYRAENNEADNNVTITDANDTEELEINDMKSEPAKKGEDKPTDSNYSPDPVRKKRKSEDEKILDLRKRIADLEKAEAILAAKARITDRKSGIGATSCSARPRFPKCR
jgi:hypothetical protein